MELIYFLSGATMMGFLTAGLFFLRFWTKTRDRLFSAFAIAFFMMSLERWIFLFYVTNSESKPYIYTIRLIAFLLIIIAIIDKNRAAKQASSR